MCSLRTQGRLGPPRWPLPHCLPFHFSQGTTQRKLSSVPHSVCVFSPQKNRHFQHLFSCTVVLPCALKWNGLGFILRPICPSGLERPVAEDHSDSSRMAPPPGTTPPFLCSHLHNSCQNSSFKSKRNLKRIVYCDIHFWLIL